MLRISRLASFAQAEPAWRRIEEAGDLYVFQTFDWLAAWCETVGRAAGIEPVLICVDAGDGEPLLLLPLGRQSLGWVTRLVWLGGVLSDYQAPLLGARWPAAADAALLRQLWIGVMEHAPDCDVIHFERQPETIAGRRNPFVDQPGARGGGTAHAARLDGAWPELYEKRVGRRRRASDRRKRRRLEERGELRLRLARSPQEARAIVETMMAQKRRRYRETGAADVFAMPGVADFYRRLAGDPGAALHAAALEVGGELLAAHCGLVHRGRFYWLMPSYTDGAARRYAPGRLLMQELLRWCVEQGLECFDFTGGDEPYKAEWCNQHLALFDLVQACSWRGRLYAARVSGSRALQGAPLVTGGLRLVRRMRRAA